MSKKNRNEVPASAIIKEFKPRTQNQHDYIISIAENDITFVDGPAGSGKSMLAIGMACQYLIEQKVEKILVSRSIIGSDNDIGYLPGDIEERIAPYMMPYLNYFEDFIGRDRTYNLIREKKLVFYPIELLRGHTYNNSFMLLEEAQNVTEFQMKLFLSRIGRGSKMVIAGDRQQSDIGGRNGFAYCLSNIGKIPKIGIIQLEKNDIQRHPVIAQLLEIFEKNGY